MNSTKQMLSFQLLLVFCLCDRFRALVNQLPGQMKRTVLVDRNTRLDALTERQEQFWEDVEEGLNGIEKYYRERGGNIDRIRRFGKRWVIRNTASLSSIKNGSRGGGRSWLNRDNLAIASIMSPLKSILKDWRPNLFGIRMSYHGHTL